MCHSSFPRKSESSLDDLAVFFYLGASYIELGTYVADGSWEVISYLTVRDIVRSPLHFSWSQALMA